MLRCENARLGGRAAMRYAFGAETGARMADTSRRRRFRPIHLLLLIPYAAMMWVPSYNRIEPMVAGIPFFYWYQMLWIVLGAGLMIPVYLADEHHDKKKDAA
jgi:hypothetical protein